MSLADGLCWWLATLSRDLLVQGGPPVIVDQVDGGSMLVELSSGDTVLLPIPPHLDPQEGDRLHLGWRGLAVARDATPAVVSASSVAPAVVAPAVVAPAVVAPAVVAPAVVAPAVVAPAVVDLPAEIDLTVDLFSAPSTPPPSGCGAAAACSTVASASTLHSHRKTP